MTNCLWGAAAAVDDHSLSDLALPSPPLLQSHTFVVYIVREEDNGSSSSITKPQEAKPGREREKKMMTNMVRLRRVDANGGGRP